MAYKVLIRTGTGKNRATMGSTPLSSKADVTRWVKNNPMGKWNTKVRVEDTSSKKVIYGTKAKFRREW